MRRTLFLIRFNAIRREDVDHILKKHFIDRPEGLDFGAQKIDIFHTNSLISDITKDIGNCYPPIAFFLIEIKDSKYLNAMFPVDVLMPIVDYVNKPLPVPEKSLEIQLEEALMNQEYEKAAELRDKLKSK